MAVLHPSDLCLLPYMVLFFPGVSGALFQLLGIRSLDSATTLSQDSLFCLYLNDICNDLISKQGAF